MAGTDAVTVDQEIATALEIRAAQLNESANVYLGDQGRKLFINTTDRMYEIADALYDGRLSITPKEEK